MKRIGCRVRNTLAGLITGLTAAGCGGSGGADPGTPPASTTPQKYSVGGTLSGLAPGAKVVLVNNGGDALTVSANGSFTFATSVASGSAYSIIIGTEPSGQICQVGSGSGTVAAAAVTSASVNCGTSYSIGGTVSGLGGTTGLVLSNGTDTLAVPGDATTFTMPMGLANAAAYNVVVQTNPALMNCTVASGSGTISASNVASIAVTCGPGTESVLYSFESGTADGHMPTGGLIQASDGSFYGLTLTGGANSYGTVYKITATGAESVLYSFQGGASDGANPIGQLVQAGDGNFYGVTNAGGANLDGVVFKITSAGSESVVYTFGKSVTDATYPTGALILGSDGNLYGTTQNGGSYGYGGGGTVFKVTTNGVETVLYSFSAGGPDGTYPTGSLIQGSDGNFYGMTSEGGAHGDGTVFRVTPGGTQSVLHSFAWGADGSTPAAGGSLILGNDGNFYGMTKLGGANGFNGCGTVFKLTPTGAETVLYSFLLGPPDGCLPAGSLIQANDRSFYGTTNTGGAGDLGVLFKLTPDGTETILHTFAGADGGAPSGALLQAKDGSIYGTTAGGGAGNEGVVFKIN